ncbi:hypothetical protein Q8G49_27660, partial [Klebsiella pneumoniae]
SIQRLVRDSVLSVGHAKALLMTPDREVQEELARITVDQAMSVRALEEAVRTSLVVDSIEAISDGGFEASPAGEADPTTAPSVVDRPKTAHRQLR